MNFENIIRDVSIFRHSVITSSKYQILFWRKSQENVCRFRSVKTKPCLFHFVKPEKCWSVCELASLLSNPLVSHKIKPISVHCKLSCPWNGIAVENILGKRVFTYLLVTRNCFVNEFSCLSFMYVVIYFSCQKKKSNLWVYL